MIILLVHAVPVHAFSLSISKSFHLADINAVRWNHQNQQHLFETRGITVSKTLLGAQSSQNDDQSSSASSSVDDNGYRAWNTPLDRPVLAAVDLVALLVFSGIGKASHSPVDGSLDLLAIAAVALPFIVAWFGTSPLTGVFSPDERSPDSNLIQDTFVKTAKGWLVAIPLGCVFRSIMKGYIVPLSFVAVTMIATLIILGAARVLFAVAEDFFVELVN